MKTVPARPIEPAEVLVVQEALLKAPIGNIATGMVEKAPLLVVIAECECGCHSLYFSATSNNDYRVADGVGYLIDGEKIGVVVWATGQRITALELVDHIGNGQLPTSVCSWEEAGEIEAKK